MALSMNAQALKSAARSVSGKRVQAKAARAPARSATVVAPKALLVNDGNPMTGMRDVKGAVKLDEGSFWGQVEETAEEEIDTLPWDPSTQRHGGLEMLPPWVSLGTPGCEGWPMSPRPNWATSLLTNSTSTWTVDENGHEWRIMTTDDLLLVSCNLPGADYLDGPVLRKNIHQIYTKLAKNVIVNDKWYPFRFWNFIPSINDLAGELEEMPVSNYMVFNYSRNVALSEAWGSEEDMMKIVSTATGIGHTGPDFTVHCFASKKQAIEVENPRQVPAYKYSAKWGPKPPSFSRGTLWDHPTDPSRTFFIAGGTAAVVGEETAHLGNFPEQLRETMRNLTSLMQNGMRSKGKSDAAVDAETGDWPLVPPYFSYSAYYRHERDLPHLRWFFDTHMMPGTAIEYKQAVVCRRELLIEIEAVAVMDQTGSVQAPKDVQDL